MFDLADSYDMRLEKMLHYYLVLIASDPIFFFGKNLIFSVISQTGRLGAYESNANEQLKEYMECQNSEPFDMGNTNL